jgi:hypothetical protein
MIGLRRPVFFAFFFFDADVLPRRGEALRVDFMAGS